MLVTGYFGETISRDSSVMWGVISGAAYFYIAYLIWFGEVAQLAQRYYMPSLPLQRAVQVVIQVLEYYQVMHAHLV